MEYKNGPPALSWFNYAGLMATAKMECNKEEECLIHKSDLELTKIATMTFDWLTIPDPAQADTVDCPQVDTEDLSISSFDIGYLPRGSQ